MKNLVYFFALSIALILAACSDSGQDITSPISPQLEKDADGVPSMPYKLYQAFPELKSASVSWRNEKGGLTIIVNDKSERPTNKYLFATIEYVNNKGATMAFLGDLKPSKYYLSGLNGNEVSTINIFYFDETLSAFETPRPYASSQLFNDLGIKGWAAGSNAVKVKSYPFPLDMNHLYAKLIASEGNQLIFLGKPRSEDFDFPKSEKLNVKDIRLFTY